MSPTLNFRELHNYGGIDDGITVPISLTNGLSRIKLFAKLDTGAAFCVFQREHGEALGLEIETGAFLRMRTATEPFDTFGHEINIESFGLQITTTAYFTRSFEFPRNVLGRNGWIRQFRLGLIDYDSTLYVSQYDDR